MLPPCCCMKPRRARQPRPFRNGPHQSAQSQRRPIKARTRLKWQAPVYNTRRRGRLQPGRKPHGTSGQVHRSDRNRHSQSDTHRHDHTNEHRRGIAQCKLPHRGQIGHRQHRRDPIAGRTPNPKSGARARKPARAPAIALPGGFQLWKPFKALGYRNGRSATGSTSQHISPPMDRNGPPGNRRQLIYHQCRPWGPTDASCPRAPTPGDQERRK